MIKLQDFARQQQVTDRQVQRLLKKYAAELEGLYERKGPNGTWFSEEACEILRSKMKTPPAPAIFDKDPRFEQLEEENRKLERELYETQKRFTDYSIHVADMLQTASNQIALAERAGEYKERIEAQDAQISDLSAERDELRQKAAELEKTAENANMELSAIKNKWYYKWFAKK